MDNKGKMKEEEFHPMSEMTIEEYEEWRSRPRIIKSYFKNGKWVDETIYITKEEEQALTDSLKNEQ